MIHKADDTFIRSKQLWRTVVLNGGLPYHDFCFADTFKLAALKNKDELQEFIKEAKSDVRNTPLLDFMKNKEFNTALKSRYQTYVSNSVSHCLIKFYNNNVGRCSYRKSLFRIDGES